eukprot:365622-Prorocentrum_minimum.AAC.2
MPYKASPPISGGYFPEKADTFSVHQHAEGDAVEGKLPDFSEEISQKRPRRWTFRGVLGFFVGAHQHAEGGDGDAVEAGELVADEDGQAKAKHGDDVGLVAQGQAEDDVSGGARTARLRHLLHGAVRSTQRGQPAGLTLVAEDDVSGGARAARITRHLPHGAVFDNGGERLKSGTSRLLGLHPGDPTVQPYRSYCPRPVAGSRSLRNDSHMEKRIPISSVSKRSGLCVTTSSLRVTNKGCAGTNRGGGAPVGVGGVVFGHQANGEAGEQAGRHADPHRPVGNAHRLAVHHLTNWVTHEVG